MRAPDSWLNNSASADRSYGVASRAWRVSPPASVHYRRSGATEGESGRGALTASSIRVCRSEAAGGRSEGPGTAAFQFWGTPVDGPEQAAPAAYARRAASDHTRIEDAVSAPRPGWIVRPICRRCLAWRV